MSRTAGPGANTESLWREAREWWNGSPYYQFRRFTDGKGVRRIEEKQAPSLGQLKEPGQVALNENHSEEWSLQHRKIRDEKISAVIGALPTAYCERAARERREGTSEAVPLLQATKSKPRITAGSYAPLHCLSGYAFGRSSMLAEELANYVCQHDCPAAAIADPHSLVGCVEFARACKSGGVKPLIGISVELPEGGEVVLIAKSKAGYVSLSRLVTACHLGEPRLFPLGSWERLQQHSEGLLCLTGGDGGPIDRLLVRRNRDAALEFTQRLIAIYGSENLFIEIERSYLPWQISVERQLLELAELTGTVPVAGGIVTHARRDHFAAQDVLLCAESLCLIDEVIGRKPRRDESQPQVQRLPERSLNAERFLHTPNEMAVLYADHPELLANTLRLAERCDDDVLPARTKLPQVFEDDDHALREIVNAEAFTAYGSKLTDKHRRRLSHEIDRINKLGFASHFLVAWDMCRFANEQNIGLSGRGSVVDSAVAYVLGLSRIDAIRHNLHFDRFLPESGKRPDIDIDFEAKRRDDVRGYLVRKYGIERVGAVAAIGSYRTRGIVRQVGKVFGLPDETIGFLAKRIHGGVSANQLEAALEGRPELRGSQIPRERFRWVFDLAERLMDVPTHIGLHSSGVVVTEGPLCDTVPVTWSASFNAPESGDAGHLRMIQWDKRSAKHYFDKFDILCLRGQDVLGGVESRVRISNPDFSASRLDITDDPDVYRAMRSGELIGIPQSASPAMRQAHARLRTNDLHDASLVQAGIRPGVGGAVKMNELIARRRGKAYSFEHPDLEKILGITYGIIVFQEQVDQLLQTFCGFTSGEAEDTREAVHKRRKEEYGQEIKALIIGRVMQRGYSRLVAEQVFDYVSGFKGYGFAQGHALAFAEVSLRSVWMTQHFPSEYFASLLSAQPAGYYGPTTIANEARIRGVRMLSIDVCRSREKFEVESCADSVTGLVVPNAAIRVGLMQLAGLSSRTRDRILECQSIATEQARLRTLQPLRSVANENGGVAVATRESDGQSGNDIPPLLPFGSVFDFAAKVEPNRDELEALILSGAFDSLHSNRRAMLWGIPNAQDYAKSMRSSGPNPFLPFDLIEPELPTRIEDFSFEERAVYERAFLGLDVNQHLMAFERERVAAKGAASAADAQRLPAGRQAVVVGNPIRLRFPPTSSGKRVVFFDLEDETGLLNVTAFDDTYQRYGHAIVTSQYVTVRGNVQDRDGYPAFLATQAFPYKPTLGGRVRQRLPVGSADFLAG